MRTPVVPPLLLCLALLAGCQQQVRPPDEPVAVSVLELRKQPAAQEFTATGDIAARTQSDLSFRLGGRVSERLVDVGSHVARGQVIARIDPQEQRAAVNSAQAGVDSAESQLRQAKLTLDRQTKLFAQGNTPRSTLDQAEEAFRVAQGGLDGARTTLEASQEQLAQTELRASADGMITTVSAEAGEVVQPAQSIFTLAEDDGRDAVFNVSERSLIDTGLHEDADVQIRLLAATNLVAKGKVREISPAVDATTGTVRIKVGLDDAPAAMTLGAAVSASAEMPGSSQIAVPWRALTADENGPAVWVVDPTVKKVSLRDVSVDSYSNGAVFISSGLSEGDTVVVNGSHLLHPQQVVAWEPQP